MHLLAADWVRFGRRRDLRFVVLLVPVILARDVRDGVQRPDDAAPGRTSSSIRRIPSPKPTCVPRCSPNGETDSSVELPAFAFPASLVKVVGEHRAAGPAGDLPGDRAGRGRVRMGHRPDPPPDVESGPHPGGPHRRGRRDGRCRDGAGTRPRGHHPVPAVGRGPTAPGLRGARARISCRRSVCGSSPSCHSSRSRS